VNVPATWQTSVMTSCLHAARQIVAGGALNDARIAENLAGPARRCNAELGTILIHSQDAATCLARSALWQLLLELSLDDPAPSELASRFKLRLDRESLADASTESRIAEAMSELKSTMLKVLPRLDRELPLRVGPLREQWEARGPGFLARAARLTQLPLATLASQVVLVHPVLGGDGTPHFEATAIQFEAILVNTNAKLPETMRLGWLLLQLAAWPGFDSVPLRHRRQFVAAVTLPSAIEAGQYVELAPPGPSLLREALDAWMLDPLPLGVSEQLALLAAQPAQSWRDTALALNTLWT